MTDRKNTSEYINGLKQYLNGLEPEMPEAFFRLAEILKHEVFELCLKKESGDYLIPYMMNDAVEFYLILRHSRMTGEYLADEKTVFAHIAREADQGENRYILIIRQESGNTCTVTFRELEESCKCYQYHRIGHFWVKGQEHWRRLVYIIGTIHDKYEYLGAEFCNKQELELLELMGFAPFRYWSPIQESLDAYYSDTQTGFERMEQLAAESGDGEFRKMLRMYRVLRFRWVSRKLSMALLSSRRDKLYRLICNKIETASLEYAMRDYGEVRNQEIEEVRKRTADILLAKGYTGSYPYFEKANTCIYAAEEHPFVLTDMEYKDFEFRIQLMVFQEGNIWIAKSEEIE